jgi:hypothetical protein
MKPTALLLLGALALCAQDKAGVIEGAVVNSVSGVGIEGATVTLASNMSVGSAGNRRYQAVSDSTGSFRITGIAPGDYSPIVQKSGFFLSLAPAVFGGAMVHVHSGEDTPPLRLEMTPPARLRGRVIGIDGKPAAKVDVATGREYADTTKTDDDGAFVFENLEPGPRSLMARVKHVRTYFPATTNPKLAELIAVAPGSDQGGYEIRLQPAARTYRVRGVVLDSAGKPAPKTVVEILPDSDGAAPGGLLSVAAGTTTFSIATHSAGVEAWKEDPAVTNADGVFEFPSVPEGGWVFRFESEELIHAAAAVDVRQDIDGLKIRLEAPFDLRGSVQLSDGSTPPDDPGVIVRLTSFEGLPGQGRQNQKDGTLLFTNVTPGRYNVQATIPSGRYYVAAVMAGTTDVTHQPVPLSAVTPPIRVILKPGATITGIVEKGEGATVLVVPQTLTPGDTGWLKACRPGGSCELAGLPPGSYYASALHSFDFRDLESISQVERLRAIVRDAVSVRVDEGGVASVLLKAP